MPILAVTVTSRPLIETGAEMAPATCSANDDGSPSCWTLSQTITNSSLPTRATVSPPAGGHQTLCDGAYNVVCGNVAHRVVDDFEVI